MTYCISFLNILDEKSIVQWAINNCPTFIYKTTKFVRGEGASDSLHNFYFETEKDAMWFRLYWQ